MGRVKKIQIKKKDNKIKWKIGYDSKERKDDHLDFCIGSEKKFKIIPRKIIAYEEIPHKNINFIEVYNLQMERKKSVHLTLCDENGRFLMYLITESEEDVSIQGNEETMKHVTVD